MNKAEARRLLRERVEALRALPYDDLKETFLLDEPTRAQPTWEEWTRQSGTTYYVKLYAYWDDKRKGNLRMFVNVDDGAGLRSFFPLSESFIVAPDGSFVGE